MERFIHDEINRLDYELVGDYYLPCFKTTQSPKIGRFGLMYLDYLRNYKRITYSGLLISGKLKEHLENIDRQAEEMLFRLINQMAKAEGITEQLKSTNQIKWVGLMNNIRNRAEDIVYNELIYN